MILASIKSKEERFSRFTLLALALVAPFVLISISDLSGQELYSPPANVSHPTNVYWGDTHLHTNLSVDAHGMGNKTLTPDDAYRFAKGEAVTGHNGQLARLRRPLDFLVVADHAVNIGVMPRIRKSDPQVLQTEIGKQWHELMNKNPMLTEEALTSEGPEVRSKMMKDMWYVNNGVISYFWSAWTTGYIEDEGIRSSVWAEVCANAERHNDPGNFTAFIGYEWTPSSKHPKSPNFHRNIIFEGGADEALQVLPFSLQDSNNVEDLWAYLDGFEEKTGGQVIAIPHNGNLSAGRMFRPVDYDDNPITTDYAKTRARWEPLYEVTQYKGDAEAHPILSPDDEFADYETWHIHGFFGDRPSDFKDQKQYEYGRSALKVGLEQQVRLGVNPFKFGMIGSTDAHTSLSTAEEDNFWGKTSLNEPSPHRAQNSWHFAASGMAAVWAEENMRSSIFAAMKRKETYATTGPRMSVRFFGGWDFDSKDAFSKDLADLGYSKGVPMGGDLTKAPRGKVPEFLIRAVKDPDGANLDRVQVIKGWRNKKGELHEKVYEAALSDGRTVNSQGKAPKVGSTVDVPNASYDNSIGDPELAVVWKDPDFDPAELAFYYARVLEIPTPRWTAYDAKYWGIELPKTAPTVTQERAYTSPIWYTP
jgi:hypothetical protein